MLKLWNLFEGVRGWRLCTDDEFCSALARRWPAVARAHDLYPGHDDDALRRARAEARQGRRFAVGSVAIHQHQKRLNRRTAP